MDNDKSPKISVASSGSHELVKILHTERRMKVYGITENEIRTLTVINVAVVVLFSIGTGCIAFGIDLHKDLLLTPNLPEQAQVLKSVLRPLSYISGGVLYLLGLLVWYYRGGFIRTLKQESN